MVRNRYKFSLSACLVLVAIISYCSGCGNNTLIGKTQDKPFEKDTTTPSTVSMTPEQTPENSNETDPATPAKESRIEEQQPDITTMPITSPSVTITNPPYANNPYYDSYEYLLASQELALKELLFIFGEEFITQNPRTIIEKYGEPMEKRPF